MENKKYFATTKNEIKIFKLVDDEHMEAHKVVTDEMIIEAIKKIDYVGPIMMATVDLGRDLGTNGCVKIQPGEEVVYLKRINRKGLTPFVYREEPEMSSLLTVGICDDPDDNGLETFFTAFIGENAPREPWDIPEDATEEEKAESNEFWTRHALVFDATAIDPGQQIPEGWE